MSFEEELTPDMRQEAWKAGLGHEQVADQWRRFVAYNSRDGEFAKDGRPELWRKWLARVRTKPAAETKPTIAYGTVGLKFTNLYPNGAATDRRFVFIEEGTPEWKSWVRYYRESKGTSPPKISRKGTGMMGWYFASQFPPGTQAPMPG